VDGLRSFLTVRFGYLFVMMATILIGVIAFFRAIETHGRDPGLHMIAASIAFGAAVLSSRGR